MCGIRGSGSRDAMADAMTEGLELIRADDAASEQDPDALLLLAGAPERGWTRHAKDGST